MKQTNSIKTLVLAGLSLLLSINFYANQPSHEEHGETHVEHTAPKEFNPVVTIMDHIKDANEWHVITLDENTGHPKHVSIPLPVIIYDNEGMKFFMSNKVAHGHEYQGYTMHEGEVISLSHKKKADMFDVVGGNMSTENVFFDLSITKNVATLILVSLILLIVFPKMAKSYKKGLVPSGVAKFLEPIVLFVRDDIAKPNFNDKQMKKFMPFLLSIFFFIWFSNMMGLIPFPPFGANLTGNISVTFVLALITMLMINLNGNKGYWSHMLWMPGVPVPVKILLAPIELVGVIAKPFALMIRLFANITAGHIVVLSLIGIIFIFQSLGGAFMAIPLALFISVLELLVAFLQAFVFTMLAALFIGTSTAEAHH